MPTLPWKSISTPQKADSYTVMVTYLPLRHYRDTPRFITYVLRVTGQLAHTPGIVGYSLRARPLHKDYWTVSAWQDAASMQRYIATLPHAAIMQKMQGAMGKTAFTSWHVNATDIPIRWEEALAHLR